MTNGERVTGISDSRYNLVSVLYYVLQGGWTYAKYIEDTEKEGDQELAGFFRGVSRKTPNEPRRLRNCSTQGRPPI